MEDKGAMVQSQLMRVIVDTSGPLFEFGQAECNGILLCSFLGRWRGPAREGWGEGGKGAMLDPSLNGLLVRQYFLLQPPAFRLLF